MPEYIITAPDGRKFKVSAPEGATREQALEKVKAQYEAEEPGMLARTGNAIKNAVVGGPADNLGESLTIPSDPQQAQRAIEEMRQLNPDSPLASAQIGADQFGNPTITVGDRTELLNRPGLSMKDIVDLPGKVMRGAEQVAPYVAGGAATAPMRAATGIPAAFGVGTATNAAEQGIQMAGGERESFDPWEALKTGGFMMAGDAAGRILVGTLARIAARKSPRAPVVDETGKFTDEAIDTLRQMDQGQLDDQIGKELARQNVLTAKEAQRFNMFKDAGVQPTRANLTQNIDDWKFQQEAVKSSGPVREVVDQQNRAMSGLFDDAITRTGSQTGDSFATGSSVSDFITNNAVKLDKNISNLYKQAGDLADSRPIIDIGRLSRTLAQKSGDNQLSGGVISSVRSALKQRGLGARPTSSATSATRINKTPNRRINAREAEDIRIELNKIFEAANPRGRQIIRELKNALDEDVFASVGDDFFKEARAAKAKFEQELSPELVSKFDKTRRTLPRDILEGRVQPDDVFKKSITSGKVRDLKDLKRYLLRQPEGAQPWNDLRGETIRHLQQKATIGETANGATISGTRLKKALDDIGTEKLKILFSPEEMKALGRLRQIGELRIPDPAVGTGMGPTAQAVQQLADQTWGVRDLVRWVDAARNISETTRAANPAAATVQALEKLPRARTSQQLRPIIGASSGSASQLGR